MMLKLSHKSILKPLKLSANCKLFENFLQTGIFPHQWEKSSVPVQKKSDKQVLKNYRLVSLLPFCRKVFERIIFNDLFKYFKENNLLSPRQSGFNPFNLGDLCIQQLIAITPEIYKAFDCNLFLEVCSVFLKSL